MGIAFMRVFGGVLIIFAILILLANHLNKPDVLTTTTFVIFFLAGAGIFAFLDWRAIKESPKKISVLALVSFFSAVVSLILMDIGEILSELFGRWVLILVLPLILISMIAGANFFRLNKKENGRLWGKPLAFIGIALGMVLSIIIIFVIVVSFSSPANNQEGKDANFNNQGVAYLQKHKYDEAIAQFNKAIEADPQCFVCYSNRAHAYQEKGDYGQAISDYSKAIENGSGYYYDDIYVDRAYAYFKNQEYDKSWEDVYRAQKSGFSINFLEELKKVSGREK